MKGGQPTALLTIDIDRSSPLPLYHPLDRGIGSATADGILPPGGMLDNELALAKDPYLPGPTVRKGMGDLARSGLPVRRCGSRTRVPASEVRRPLLSPRGPRRGSPVLPGRG